MDQLVRNHTSLGTSDDEPQQDEDESTEEHRFHEEPIEIGPQPNKEHRSDDDGEPEEHRSDEEPSNTEPNRKHPVVDAPNPFLRTRSRRIKPPERLMTIMVNARDELN